MLLTTLLKNYKISKESCEPGESEKSTYSGSTDPIVFIRLPKDIEGQNCLVLSHNAATAIKEKSKKLGELEVTYNEDFGWGIVMPSSFKKLDVEW